MRQNALVMLYRELKKAKIALSRAEERPGVKDEELLNISKKIATLDWLIGAVLSMKEEDNIATTDA